MDWTDISTTNGSRILGVVYVEGTTWVTVRSRSIEQSTDHGLTWTEVLSVSDFGLYRCIAVGNGYVVVGMSNNLYVYSTDSGATFSAEQTGPFTSGATGSTKPFDCITWVWPSTFMAAASGWTARTTDVSSWTTPVEASVASSSIDLGSGQWVLIAVTGYTQYSDSFDNGDTWTPLSFTAPVLDMGMAKYSGYWGEWIGRGRAIGAGTENVFTSEDAVTWTGYTVNSSGGSSIPAVGFVGPTIIIGRNAAGGDTSKRIVTTDDLFVTLLDETSPFDAGYDVTAIDYGNGRAIAVGSGGVIAYRGSPESTPLPPCYAWDDDFERVSLGSDWALFPYPDETDVYALNGQVLPVIESGHLIHPWTGSGSDPAGVKVASVVRTVGNDCISQHIEAEIHDMFQGQTDGVTYRGQTQLILIADPTTGSHMMVQFHSEGAYSGLGPFFDGQYLSLGVRFYYGANGAAYEFGEYVNYDLGDYPAPTADSYLVGATIYQDTRRYVITLDGSTVIDAIAPIVIPWGSHQGLSTRWQLGTAVDGTFHSPWFARAQGVCGCAVASAGGWGMG